MFITILVIGCSIGIVGSILAWLVTKEELFIASLLAFVAGDAMVLISLAR